SMWIRFSGGIPEQATTASRASQLLWMTCYINLILFAFNLLPLPPLDGSHILANLSPRYRELLSTERFRSMSIVLFIAAFVLIGFLFEPMQQVALVLTEMLSGVDLFLTGD
ncbi:MAG: site-2 protease family protein, partial [Planctomycetota bacterium]